MLKTVSSIANAIGALNYKGTWDANANVPPLASGVGTKGDYYVVGTDGSTTLDGISNWGIGDWAVFNGSVWQRVEGGANLNGVDLSVSGTSQLTGNATFSNNLVQGTAAKGVNFTANTPAAGMTSQLLNWYEEGTFVPVLRDGSSGNAATAVTTARYTRIGRVVQIQIELSSVNTTGLSPANTIYITGLPFICVSTFTPADVFGDLVASTTGQLQGLIYANSFLMVLYNNTVTGHTGAAVSQITSGTSAFFIQANYITS